MILKYNNIEYDINPETAQITRTHLNTGKKTIVKQVIRNPRKNAKWPSVKYPYVRVIIRGKQMYLHRLMYETFKGEIAEDMVVDHIDGNRLNNNINNLQLMTRADNSRKTALETMKKGNLKIGVKTPVTLENIETGEIKTWASISECAKDVNAPIGSIAFLKKGSRSNTKKGKTYTHKVTKCKGWKLYQKEVNNEKL